MITRRKINFNNITQGGKPCLKPKIQFESLSDCVSLACINKNSIEIEVLDDCPNPCFRVIIECEDCHSCPPDIRDICLCTNSDDCPVCEVCIDGLCTELCPDRLCDPNTETCVDCISADDCECDQVCINGECACPADKIVNNKGCCVDCLDNSDCPPCTRCIGGECIPVNCPDGVCDPNTDSCVECNSSSDCSDPNECCVNRECICCSGYVRNSATGLCEEEPECVRDSDCSVCEICVDGECQPRICPEGFICVNDICVEECDCENKDCSGNKVCVNQNASTCYCTSCDGMCNNSNDCLEGCYCDEGNCKKNPCLETDCDTGYDCGVGCGCINGKCLPCTSLDCGTTTCADANGCECLNNECVNSNCVGTCNNASDCAPGCGCFEGQCTSCEDLSCGFPCDSATGCGCPNGDVCEYIGGLCNEDGLTATFQTNVQGGTGSTTDALTQSNSVQAIGLNTSPYLYYKHSFSYSVGNSSGGVWEYSPSQGSWTTLSPSGTNLTLGHGSSPVNHNLYGFLVRFTDSDGQRSITWQTNWNASLGDVKDPNVWVTSVVNNSGAGYSGTPPTVTRSICTNKASFAIAGNLIKTGGTGNLNVSLNGSPSGNCAEVTITGCGTWEGTINVVCQGQVYTIPVESLSIEHHCCDPADPNCGGDSGSCEGVDVTTIDLIQQNLFGQGSNAGHVMVVPDPASLPFIVVYNLSGISWGVTGDTSMVGPMGPGVIVKRGVDGCVTFSATAGACEEMEGQLCFDDCEYEVALAPTGGDNEYIAILSHDIGLFPEYVDWYEDGNSVPGGVPGSGVIMGTKVVSESTTTIKVVVEFDDPCEEVEDEITREICEEICNEIEIPTDGNGYLDFSINYTNTDNNDFTVSFNAAGRGLSAIISDIATHFSSADPCFTGAEPQGELIRLYGSITVNSVSAEIPPNPSFNAPGGGIATSEFSCNGGGGFNPPNTRCISFPLENTGTYYIHAGGENVAIELSQFAQPIQSNFPEFSKKVAEIIVENLNVPAITVYGQEYGGNFNIILQSSVDLTVDYNSIGNTVSGNCPA